MLLGEAGLFVFAICENIMMNQLLDDIVVVDLSRILAGPWATQLLADYGATVWKIEHPTKGDDTRSWGPPFAHINDEQRLSAYFMTANRGKHSVALNISDESHQKILHQMIARADVLVENFKVGGLQKYGLDYDSVKALNPKLVYCSITGFGQTGPDAKQAGYDAMIQARGGLMSITGNAEGESPDYGPQKVGVAVCDLMTGMYAANGILAALFHAQRTGEGQHIDLALLDTQVAMLANQGMNFLTSGKSPSRKGNAHPNIVPYQTFATQNGHVMLAVGNDAQFKRLTAVIGLPELSEDTRFITNQSRVDNREALLPVLTKALLQQTTEYWLSCWQAEGIPCGPIQTIAQVFDDQQVQHREMQQSFPGTADQDSNELSFIANPLKFSKTPIQYNKPPPNLGEDNDALFDWINKS